MPWVAERAHRGWKAVHHLGNAADAAEYEPLSENEEEVNVDLKTRVGKAPCKGLRDRPIVCSQCGAEMKVIAVIEDPDELGRILQHPGCTAEQVPKAPTRLVNNGRSPPGFDPDRPKSRAVPEKRSRH